MPRSLMLHSLLEAVDFITFHSIILHYTTFFFQLGILGCNFIFLFEKHTSAGRSGI